MTRGSVDTQHNVLSRETMPRTSPAQGLPLEDWSPLVHAVTLLLRHGRIPAAAHEQSRCPAATRAAPGTASQHHAMLGREGNRYRAALRDAQLPVAPERYHKALKKLSALQDKKG